MEKTCLLATIFPEGANYACYENDKKERAPDSENNTSNSDWIFAFANGSLRMTRTIG